MKNFPLHIAEINPYIRKAGYETSSNWHGQKRRIYDHEFIFAEKGKGIITINDRSYPIQPGALFLIKPDTSHYFDIKDTDGAVYWIHFDYFYRHDVMDLNRLVQNERSVLFNQHLPNHNLLRYEPVFEKGFALSDYMLVKDIKTISSIFKTIILLHEKKEALWELQAKIQLLQLFEYLFHHHLTRDTSTQIVDLCPYLVAYIEKNYYKKISLSHLSHVTGYHADYISKKFKQEIGMNITVYIHTVRIAHAKDLLLNTDYSISYISNLVGYSDLYYFSKMMKKYVGMSPTTFRNSH
ncbi:AraC family transcriptional regulator [Vallitalea okinawensis]|uniref:AraC family transcriptional regulator n=1 Tax=Vallitalea okinawensis TaxID=2078660 RepID=UPI000CFD0E42|nr:AraC family transcriptional regulator [Vallitalea okinawensis]